MNSLKKMTGTESASDIPEPPPEHPLVTRVIGVGPVIFVLSLVNVRAVVVVVFVPPVWAWVASAWLCPDSTS